MDTHASPATQPRGSPAHLATGPTTPTLILNRDFAAERAHRVRQAVARRQRGRAVYLRSSSVAHDLMNDMDTDFHARAACSITTRHPPEPLEMQVGQVAQLLLEEPGWQLVRPASMELLLVAGVLEMDTPAGWIFVDKTYALTLLWQLVLRAGIQIFDDHCRENDFVELDASSETWGARGEASQYLARFGRALPPLPPAHALAMERAVIASHLNLQRRAGAA